MTLWFGGSASFSEDTQTLTVQVVEDGSTGLLLIAPTWLTFSGKVAALELAHYLQTTHAASEPLILTGPTLISPKK